MFRRYIIFYEREILHKLHKKAKQIRQRMWKEIDKILTKTEKEIVELMKEDAPQGHVIQKNLRSIQVYFTKL